MTPDGEKTVRVGPKGQVVIPKRIRDALGIAPGDEVQVSERSGEARVRKLLTLDELRGVLGPAPSGMKDFEDEKRRERAEEDRKNRERNRWPDRS
jgi:antitoxin PrlF